jgi:hypothetical protein
MELRKYFARPPLARTRRPVEDAPLAAVRDFVLVPAAAPHEPAKVKSEAAHFPYHKVHHRRPYARPKRRRLVLLLTILANGVALALLGAWLQSGNRPKLAENPLQTAQSSSKVKPTSAQAPEAPPPLPPMPIAAPKLEEKKPVPPPPTLPSEPLITIPAPPVLKLDIVSKPTAPEKPPEPPAPKLDKEPVLAIWQPYRVFAPTHGETPMLHNWKMLKWASAMAVAVAVTPATFAQDKKDEILDAIKALEKKVSDGFGRVQQDMDTLRPIVLGNSARLEVLEKKVADLRSEVDAIKGKSISLYQSDKAALDSMKDRLDQMEKALNGGKVVTKSISTTGRIILQNRYPEAMWFVINGKTYNVPAYSDVVLDGQTLGTFSYEAWSPTHGRRAASTGVLNPDRPFRLLATLP